MLASGNLYCDFCQLAISKQRHSVVKKPLTKGDQTNDYWHFHHRETGDCYDKWMKLHNIPISTAKEDYEHQ